jgi:hypothetical protein
LLWPPVVPPEEQPQAAVTVARNAIAKREFLIGGRALLGVTDQGPAASSL